jgi:hypothetical protein
VGRSARGADGRRRAATRSAPGAGIQSSRDTVFAMALGFWRLASHSASTPLWSGIHFSNTFEFSHVSGPRPSSPAVTDRNEPLFRAMLRAQQDSWLEASRKGAADPPVVRQARRAEVISALLAPLYGRIPETATNGSQNRWPW